VTSSGSGHETRAAVRGVGQHDFPQAIDLVGQAIEHVVRRLVGAVEGVFDDALRDLHCAVDVVDC